MNCFSCFTCQRSKKHLDAAVDPDAQHHLASSKPPDNGTQCQSPHIQAQTFTFRELAIATRNFRQECLLGEGGFGRVYKGTIPATGKVVAVKQLDRNGMNMGKDFLSEVALLSHLNHDNLVNLIGYCVDGDQRLLVYEYMSGGSVYDRLFGPEEGRSPLDWFNRMKIASGAARGLEYLHDKGIVHRDLKSSNILLNDNLNAKLSDVGLNKLFGGDRTNLISPGGVTGTYGYSAPEYTRTGQLTSKSDVYGFGVVLLELITGRRAIDTTRPNEEQNLVSWAQPLFRNPKEFPAMADPVLRKQFPEKDLNQAVAVAAMCLQEEEGARPLMSDVVITLSFLSMEAGSLPPATLPPAAQQDDDYPKQEEEEEEEEGEYYDETEEEEEEEEEEGGSSSGSWEEVSMTSSKRSRNLSRRKSSCRELRQKSSKKEGSGSRRSSRSSYKISTEWEGEEEEEEEEEEEMTLHHDERGSSRLSQRDISFGLTSSWGSMRSSDEDGDPVIIGDSRGSPEVAHPPLQHALTAKLPSKDFRRARLATSSAKV